MKKYVFLAALAAAAAVRVNALAAPDVKTEVEDGYVRVIVSGSILSGSEDKTVDFYVDKADNPFVHADQKQTGEGGEYKFSARINPSLGGGVFKYTVKADGEIAESGEFKIADMDKAAEIAEKIRLSQSAAEVKAALDGFDPCLDVPLYDKASKNVIYSGLYNDREKITSVKSLYEKLTEYTVLSAINDGADGIISGGRLMYMDIIGADEETTEAYEKKLTDKGRSNVNSEIVKNNYERLGACADDLKLLVLVNMITNADGVSYDDAEKIIQSYGEKIGINILEYNGSKSKNDIKMRLLNSGAKNPSELKAAYESAVKYYSGKGGSSSGGGSGSSSGGSKSGAYVPQVADKAAGGSSEDNAAPFSDMTGYEWAQEAVSALKDKKVINGRSEESFAPSENITREEFVKTVMLALGLCKDDEKADNAHFADVPPDAWFAGYVYKAEALAVINGISENEFGAGRQITRQDMAAIAFRALRLTKAQLDTNADAEAFSDQSMVSDYADLAVRVFKKCGLLNGYPDGSFSPYGAATRAETAQFIWKLINLKGVTQ